MDRDNCFIKTITLLLLISLFSCKPKEQGLESKVRDLIESKFSSKQNLFIIDHIKYDTIGTGDWSYNLAQSMIDNPELFSDKELFEKLVWSCQSIDSNDHRMRIIANIRGHTEIYKNVFGYEYEYHIGIIGDSLTNVEKKPIEALLNICSVEDAIVIDIAKVIGLANSPFFLSKNTIISEILSENWYRGNNVKMKYSKINPIFNDKGKVKDDIVRLQFMGIYLNDRIDSVLLRYARKSIIKDFSFDNYSCYHYMDKIETKSGGHTIENQLYTIDDRIVMIKAICYDNIKEELLEMFKTKYGDDSYIHPIDNTLVDFVYDASFYLWSFLNQGIVIVNNTDIYDEYYPTYTYDPPKLKETHYYFKNITIVYCDKQMYRRLVQKEQERKFSIQREQFLSDSVKRVEKYKKDSIQKDKEKERLTRNSTQI